jgi:hypothetical protein
MNHRLSLHHPANLILKEDRVPGIVLDPIAEITVYLLNVVLLTPVAKIKKKNRFGQTNLATIIVLYVIVLEIEIGEEIDIKVQKTLSVENLQQTQVGKKTAVIPIREIEIALAEGNMKNGQFKMMITQNEEIGKKIIGVTVMIEVLNAETQEIDLPTMIGVLKVGMKIAANQTEIAKSKRKDLWTKKSDQRID